MPGITTEPRVPGRYVVRHAGSGGTNNGRSNRTRSFNVVIDLSQSVRSAITVAGIVGHSASSPRSCGSTGNVGEGEFLCSRNVIADGEPKPLAARVCAYSGVTDRLSKDPPHEIEEEFGHERMGPVELP